MASKQVMKKDSTASSHRKKITIQSRISVTIEAQQPKKKDFRTRCRDIISSMEEIVECEEFKGIGNCRNTIERLRENLVEEDETTIAVVGETGEGKSTLLDALLDHDTCVIPKSSLGVACTSVAVEIVENKTNNMFEAEIQFMSRKEWLDVLRPCFNEDGQLDREDKDARNMLCSLYGELEDNVSLDTLADWDDIQGKFNQVEKISKDKPGDFKTVIEKYISSVKKDGERKYWPMVKLVILKIPKSSVLSSGVKLVDLPGTRDSNPARDKIAKKYIKKCNAVFVVARIHRAVDNQTAKDLLAKEFETQLRLDGQYRCVSFVCTKTDLQVECEDIIETLDLKEKVKEFEDEIAESERRKRECQTEIGNIEKQIKHTGSIGKGEKLRLYEEKEKMQDTEKKEKANIEEQKKNKIVTCAKARNEMVRGKISKPAEEDIGQADFKVFCVSSNNFLRLRRKGDAKDEPPLVFHDIDDTEILQIRAFIKQMVQQKHEKMLEIGLKSVQDFVLGVYSYIDIERGDAKKNTREKNKNIIENLQKELFEEIEEKEMKTIKAIEETIENFRLCAKEGVDKAKFQAEKTVEKWERLHHQTYIATAKRDGFFKHTNFNFDLAQPLFGTITIKWEKMIHTSKNGLWKILLDVQDIIWSDLSEFSTKIEKKILDGVTREDIKKTTKQLLTRVGNDELKKRFDDEMRKVKEKSIHIYEIISIVKENMKPAYTYCKSQKEKRSFKEMKEEMKKHIEATKDTMFEEIEIKLNEGLDSLKNEMIKSLKVTLENFEEDVKHLYKSHWDDPFKDENKRKECLEKVKKYKEEIDDLLKEYSREHSTFSAPTPSTSGTNINEDGQVNTKVPPKRAMQNEGNDSSSSATGEEDETNPVKRPRRN